MTRVETPPPAVPPPARHFHFPIPKFSLGRLIKLAIVVGVIWVLVQVARTGVWHIPLISTLAYHAPHPSRVVQPMVPSAGDILARVPAALATGHVSITEAELSALAQQGNQKLHLGLANVQTVVTDSTIELSFLLPRHNNAIARLDLEPIITQNGDPDFRVVRSRLGLLDVPQWMIGQPARRLLQLQLQPAFTLLPDMQAVSPVAGTLAFSFAPA